MIGIFPVNYVEIIPYDGVRMTPKKPTESKARVKYNFVAQTPMELSLVKGETVLSLVKSMSIGLKAELATAEASSPFLTLKSYHLQWPVIDKT